MGLAHKLNGTTRAFIAAQPLFFVATAAPEGRVNLSPKGADTLRVDSDTFLRWLNLTGSGNETAGHLRLSDRITLMFCAFSGDAMILRVYGRGRALHPRDDGWTAATADFADFASARQVIAVDIEAVQVSCGSGVPRMDLVAPRVESELDPF